MAGYTKIENHLIDWVERKYAQRVIGVMNTEWEMGLSKCPEGVSEYEYMRDSIIALHRKMNKGADNAEEAADQVLHSGGE